MWQHVCLRNTQETLGFGHITRSAVCFLFSPVDPSQCWVPTAHSADSCESTVNTRKRLGHGGTFGCPCSMFQLHSKINLTTH